MLKSSSRIQAALVAFLVALVVALNSALKWGLDTPSIVTLATTGGALIGAIAVIDHGEPADPAPPAAASTIVDAARAVVAQRPLQLTDAEKNALVLLTPQGARADVAALLGTTLTASAPTPAQ